MKSFLTVILFIICFGLSAQQQQNYAHQLALIDSIRTFIFHDLKLDPGKDFYTEWGKGKDSMAVYLYVSQNDSVLIPDNLYKDFWRFDNEASAIAKSRQLQAKGYETLIYKTAGNSDAHLNRKLLSYPDEAIAFILFHEATHRRQKDSMPAIPYIFEEALCDAVANDGCVEFAQKTKLLNLKKVLLQKKIFENLYAYLNRARQEIENTPATNHAEIIRACNDEILQATKSGNQFVKDRMIYPVNHAYFLRLQSYSLNYFMMLNMLGPDIDIKRVTRKIQRLTTVKLPPIFKEEDDEPAEITLPKQPSMFDSDH